MSIALKRTVILSALTAVGALAAANALSKPTKIQTMASNMRSQLDDYNSKVHTEQAQDPTYASPRARAPDFIFFIDET